MGFCGFYRAIWALKVNICDSGAVFFSLGFNGKLRGIFRIQGGLRYGAIYLNRILQAFIGLI